MIISLENKEVVKYLALGLKIDEKFIKIDENGFFIESDNELELALIQRK